MTVELALVIAGLSLVFNIGQGIYNMKRSNSADAKEDSSQLTTVIVKLENISTGITEIKAELNSVKQDMKEDHDSLIKVDASVKSCWKRVEYLEGLIEGKVVNRDQT